MLLLCPYMQLMKKYKRCLCLSMVLAILLLFSSRAVAAKISWSGEWRRLESSKYFYAGVKITNVTPKTFHFSISAMSGANEGEMEGFAEIQGDRAFYSDEKKCRVIFKMVGANLVVKTTGECQWCAGVGVYFDGTYRKDDKIPKPTLKSYGIFQDDKEEQAFRQMVGNDYELFVDSMAWHMEEDDLDGMGAKVVSGTVRGLVTFVGAVIMFRDAHNMWAAVIDNKVVKYYTTVPDFKTKLPHTIDIWRELFKEKKVLFMSAPQKNPGNVAEPEKVVRKYFEAYLAFCILMRIRGWVKISKNK